MQGLGLKAFSSAAVWFVSFMIRSMILPHFILMPCLLSALSVPALCERQISSPSEYSAYHCQEQLMRFITSM